MGSLPNVSIIANTLLRNQDITIVHGVHTWQTAAQNFTSYGYDTCTEDAVPNFLLLSHSFTPANLLIHKFGLSILPVSLCQHSTELISMFDPRFIDDSVLDVIVPQHSDHEVEDIIASTDTVEPEESGVFPQIPQRSLLYFGKLKNDRPVNLRSYSFTGT